MIICNNNKMIGYISPCQIGKRHDYRFLKEEFPPTQDWFKHFNIQVDLSYLGIAKDYICPNIIIPPKRKKKMALTAQQKRENHFISSKRVVVEHTIAGLKRYRILSERLRMHLLDLYNDILGVCAGLWNFYLADFS